MAVPKRRRSDSRQRQRRMHLHIKPYQLVPCAKCGAKKLAHNVCATCGFYRGREVVNVLAKLDKKERKAREKEISNQEKANPGGELNTGDLNKPTAN